MGPQFRDRAWRDWGGADRLGWGLEAVPGSRWTGGALSPDSSGGAGVGGRWTREGPGESAGPEFWRNPVAGTRGGPGISEQKMGGEGPRGKWPSRSPLRGASEDSSPVPDLRLPPLSVSHGSLLCWHLTLRPSGRCHQQGTPFLLWPWFQPHFPDMPKKRGTQGPPLPGLS